MKRRYIKPQTEAITLSCEGIMLGTSPDFVAVKPQVSLQKPLGIPFDRYADKEPEADAEQDV